MAQNPVPSQQMSLQNSAFCTETISSSTHTTTYIALPGEDTKEPHFPSLLTESTRDASASPLPSVNLLDQHFSPSALEEEKETDSSFNSFNFWRMPLPDIDVDFVGEGETEAPSDEFGCSDLAEGDAAMDEVTEALNEAHLQENQPIRVS